MRNKNSVGADDSVGPYDGRSIVGQADRVVRPYSKNSTQLR